MSIKYKLVLSTGLLIISMLILLILRDYTASSINGLSKGVQLSSAIEIGILELRRDEKDFIARKNLKYVQKHQDHSLVVGQRIQELQATFENYDIDSTDLQQLEDALNQYTNHFAELVKEQKIIGLNPTSGLYGELRKASHSLEAAFKGHSDSQFVSLLQLRRAEKDFMLRLDNKYIQKFDNNYQPLLVLVADEKAVVDTLNVYREKFISLTKAHAVMGMTAYSVICEKPCKLPKAYSLR